MALHDRLRPPTLQAAPVRAAHGLPVALALVVLAAGFAYAMPNAYTASAEEEGSPETVAVVASESPTPEPTESPVEVTTENDTEGGGGKDNHGAAVSTAAHCDVHGKAHGELVRSIAKDKDATVADAEAACAAAVAAAEVAPAKVHGKPATTKKVREPREPKVKEVRTVAPAETKEHGKPVKTKP